MRFTDLSLKTITFIQVAIAVIISILCSFVIPLEWRPLAAKLEEKGLLTFESGGLGPNNYTFFTLSQWFFSFSIAWFIKRDNPYINNYIIFSLVPLIYIIFHELIIYGLFYDYIHILPAIISICILSKERTSLKQKLMVIYACIFAIWFNFVWLLELAYIDLIFLSAILLGTVYPICFIIFSFLFIENEEE